ncbi:MAG: AAA family ATPase, partial [Acidimicrobiales bacterium]
MADESVIPSPSLVVLVGPSGAGKSTWAEANFAAGQILSSDRFRALVGSGPADRTAGTEAFA